MDKIPGQTRRVIIDCDPTFNLLRDIDDVLAVIYLLMSEDVVLEGITINFGNNAAETCYRQMKEVLKEINREDIPVFLGAKSRGELGKQSDASKFIIETVKQNPGEIDLIAVAPLTNVATVITIAPEVKEKFRSLTIMGGAVEFGYFNLFGIFGEFNFKMDAKAAGIVLNSGMPMSLFSMDCCGCSTFTQDYVNELKAVGTPLSKYLVAGMKKWFSLNKIAAFRRKGFVPWDVVACAYLTNPEIFSNERFDLKFRDSGIRGGSFSGLQLNPDSNIVFPKQHDGDKFMSLFMDRLKAFAA